MKEKDNGFQKVSMTLAEEVTFFNKATILKELDKLPVDSYLELDVRKTRYLDHDIIEILEDFVVKAKEKGLKVISEIEFVSQTSTSFNSYWRFFPNQKALVVH